MDDCVFCSEFLGNGGQTTKLGAKGCDGIRKANDLRQADVSVAPGQIVHTKCRKNFCSQLSIELDIRKRRYDCTGGSSGTVRARRSAGSAFHYSEHCLLCGTPDKYQGKQKTHKLLPVRTMDFQRKVTESCVKRNDAWYERSAAVALGTDIPNYRPEQVIQYMADNVDHNIRTIDGLNTFHGMGMIVSVTPGSQTSTRVPRVSVTPKDVVAVGRINIRHLTSPRDGLDTLRYEVLQDEMEKDRSTNLDLLWKLSLTLRSPRPAWSGMMQAVHTGVHPGQSSVFLLPMIDMNSSDPTCIYSTLTFLSERAKQYNAKVIITFGKPLWWKALTIIESQPEGSDLRQIVLRMGGFHTLMSFLGSIGNIMSASGLRSVLQLVYAENTVTHMLSGKAYDRAIRGHLLVDAALNTLLAERILGTLCLLGRRLRMMVLRAL